MTPTDLTDTFPAKFLAGVLLGVLGVVGLALRFALGWLIKRDETREARIEVLEKATTALSAALEGKTPTQSLTNMGERFTAQLAAQDAEHARRIQTMAIDVAVLKDRAGV